MASAGRILGYAGIAFIVLAALAIPNLVDTRHAVDESVAAGGLRSIWKAALTYSDTYHQGYPLTLAALGPAPAGQKPSAEAANLLDSSLASGKKSGYIFRYQPVKPRPDGTIDRFDANADPSSSDKSYRHFHMDEDGVLHYEFAAPAGRNSEAVR
jgi:type IV pilus assembly protein PilA